MSQPETADRLPRLFTALRGYTWSKLLSDLVAGLTVGLVALPLAMAFAISSGVPPEAGLYCAVVAGFLISALGGSLVQIGGPTGAFVVVVAAIVQKHGIDGLFMCTLLAGIMLVVLGATGLGSAVKYIPRPVIIGFTNGIAILIASTQIKDFFGLSIEQVPGEFLPRIQVLVQNWQTASLPATILSVSALLLMIALMRWARKIPGAIAAMVLGTLAVWWLQLPVETIQSRFGGIPVGLPAPQLPVFRADLILPLLAPALTIAMLGAIESLLSAVVADRMSGDRHSPNTELVAQGIANIAAPLFGGLPATGAIARTATNVRSGAKTPVAGMIHALTLLVILLVGGPLARMIPLPILAAILMIVAYNMGEWREIPDILRQTKADAAVWFITLFLTVIADLTVAVQAGMILAALLYIRRVTSTTSVSRVTPEYVREGLRHSLQLNDLPPEVAVYRIHGPFLFGSTDKLDVIDHDLPSLPAVVIIRLRNMTALDGTGLHALEDVSRRLQATGRQVILCGMRGQPQRLIDQSALRDILGSENIQPNVEEAIRQAQKLLHSDVNRE